MAKGMERKANGSRQGEISTNRRNRRNVQQWHNKYFGRRIGLSKENQYILDRFRDIILVGIDKATMDDGLPRLENWEDIRECYSYELALQGVDYLLMKNPSMNQVVKWAKGLTEIRKGSWFDSLIRQRESIHIHSEPAILEHDEEGEILEIGLPESGWAYPLNAPNPYRLNPEEYLLWTERYQKIVQLPSAVGSLRAKRASDWRVILDTWLGGKEPMARDAKKLGLPKNEFTSLKHQAKGKAKMILAQDDEEVAEKQALYKTQKNKKYKIRKSTFANRKVLFRARDTEEEKPRLIRHWKVIDGLLTLILDSNRPAASEVVHFEMKEAT